MCCCCFFTSLPLKKILRLAGLPSCGILHLLHLFCTLSLYFLPHSTSPLLPVGIPKKKSTSLQHSAQLSSVKRNPFCDQDSSLDSNGHRPVVGCVIWHTEWGWAILCYCIQISPALHDPNLADGYVSLLGGAGAFILYPHITHCHCAKTHKTLSGQISAPLLAFPLRVHRSLIVGHVSLWDRLPSMQVDQSPASALRHYFWPYRHLRTIGMGRGRGRQVSLRQYVDAVPRLKRQLEVPVVHGVL